MRLAGEQELERTGSARDAPEPSYVVKDQIRTLVWCRPACEADEQRTRIKGGTRATSDGGDELCLRAYVCLANLVQWAPDGVTQVPVVVSPLGHVFVVERSHGRCSPGGCVH